MGRFPFWEHFWTERATTAGLKMSQGIHRWRWNGRPLPEPVRLANRGANPPELTPVSRVGDLTISTTSPPGEGAEALQENEGQRLVCTAQGTGGDIDVTCPGATAAVLTVKENAASGWGAAIVGRPAPLRPYLAGGRSGAGRRRTADQLPLPALGCPLGVASLRRRGHAGGSTPGGRRGPTPLSRRTGEQGPGHPVNEIEGVTSQR